MVPEETVTINFGDSHPKRKKFNSKTNNCHLLVVNASAEAKAKIYAKVKIYTKMTRSTESSLDLRGMTLLTANRRIIY